MQKSPLRSRYSNPKQILKEKLKGQKEPKSQFERAVEELGAEGNSRQLSSTAKGRIERLFKTFQNRLIKDRTFRDGSLLFESLRLKEIRNLKLAEEAESFLPNF